MKKAENIRHSAAFRGSVLSSDLSQAMKRASFLVSSSYNKLSQSQEDFNSPEVGRSQTFGGKMDSSERKKPMITAESCNSLNDIKEMQEEDQATVDDEE